MGRLYDCTAHVSAVTYYFLSTFGIFRTEQTYRKHGANLPKYLAAEPATASADAELGMQ